MPTPCATTPGSVPRSHRRTTSHHPIARAATTATVLALSGCISLTPVGVPPHPWADVDKDSAPLCKQDQTCTQGEAVAAIAKVQVYCGQLREYYERGGQVSSGQRLFIGVLGALAGSVFSVVSGGSAAKAWAGLSGASSGIQTQIDQSSSRPPSSPVIGAIATAEVQFADDIKRLAASTASDKWTQMVGAALVQPSRCSSASGKALQDSAEAAAKSAAAAVAAASSAAAAASAASAAAGQTAAASAPN